MKNGLLCILVGILACLQQQTAESRIIPHHRLEENRLTAFAQSKAEHSWQDYDVRSDPRIKETLSPYKQNSANHHKITYKVEGRLWKPKHRLKVNAFLPSRYKIKTSGPLNSREAAHKIPAVFASRSTDASELTRHQVLANRKVDSAYKRQLSPSRKAELHSQDIDSKWKTQSITDSDEDSGKKHFRQSNTVSDARNHAAPAYEEVKDEPLHITLYSSIGDTQALQQKNSNPIYNQKRNFAASEHRPSDNKDTYSKENYDKRKMMAEKLPNRFRKMINNKNEDAIKSANTENMHNKMNYPDKTKIHQEKDFNDDSADEEHGLEETLTDEEMENNLYDTLHDQQNPSAYEDMQQESEDEEESDDNGRVYDKYGGEENYDNEHYETLKSDGSNIGQEAVYQQKDYGVRRHLSKVLYASKKKNGKRHFKCHSSSAFGENGTEDNR